jgi:hypothetical protein
MLTRDDLLGLEANKTAPPTRLHVAAWGGDVFLLDPTAQAYDEWALWCEKNKDKADPPYRAKLASLLLCDESGKRLFTGDDVQRLAAWKPDGLTEVWKVGIELLKVDDKEIEDQAEKSAASP